MNQNQVAWSCLGMCGTKLKNRHVLVLCHVVSHAIVSCVVVTHMCELSFATHRLWSNFESGGRIMPVKRAQGRAMSERRGMLPLTEKFKDSLTSPSIRGPVGCLLLLL